jgi:hypothetical protein
MQQRTVCDLDQRGALNPTAGRAGRQIGDAPGMAGCALIPKISARDNASRVAE